jgi:CspA family cold shock protein
MTASRPLGFSEADSPRHWLKLPIWDFRASDHPPTPCLKETKMAKGTVKWYNSQKGYGFIQPESGGKDVFVHATALEAAGLRTLADGQQVTFELKEERGRTSATGLKLA